MKTFEELQSLVEAWANERGIYDYSTATAQFDKFMEEAEELRFAVEMADAGVVPINSEDDVRHELGDVLVTLINLARLLGVNPVGCLEAAYEKISGRRGKMVDGLFVKE
jgi:NTP pyrophosphatase (non-canonical NTP hydrolase)